jgi:predicted DNA-binding transcriptional regulator AlpA
MDNEILEKYFTDAQVAAVLGVTIGGLRNKLYRHKDEELPSRVQVTSRARIWKKESTREWLIRRFGGDVETVDMLMARGEATPPGASFGTPRSRRKSAAQMPSKD